MSQQDYAAETDESVGGASAAAGKYLTFELGDEYYGLEILKVQEIIGMQPITRVPRTPQFVRGVINLRGKVIPVIDLRAKFDLPQQEDTDRTCTIVVQIAQKGQQVITGIIVDEVSEVMDISADQIQPPPALGTSVDTEFIMGMGKVGEHVVMLLDIDRALSSGEFEAIGQAAQQV
jgi:purine-binding chemotaxis protein CheW